MTLLVHDVLLAIALLLDPSSALALLRVDRQTSTVLGTSRSFWRHICESLALQTDEENPLVDVRRELFMDWKNGIVVSVKTRPSIPSGEYRLLSYDESLQLKEDLFAEEIPSGSEEDYMNYEDERFKVMFVNCKEDLRKRSNGTILAYKLRDTRTCSTFPYYIYR